MTLKTPPKFDNPGGKERSFFPTGDPDTDRFIAKFSRQISLLLKSVEPEEEIVEKLRKTVFRLLNKVEVDGFYAKWGTAGGNNVKAIPVDQDFNTLEISLVDDDALLLIRDANNFRIAEAADWFRVAPKIPGAVANRLSILGHRKQTPR